jgi:putative DNA primase/helicase
MLEAISNLVPDPIFAGSITSSSLFRIIDARRPTLLIDEADRLFNGHNQELLAIFNSGHRRSSAYVLRSVPQPDGTYVADQFSTFAPIAFAGIDALPETQQNRSIVLRLKRALAGELKHHLRDGKSAVLLEFRRKLARWAADLEELPDPAMPKALFNRPGDNWRPLLAIAQIAGGDWPRLAERAALASLEDEDPNELIRLLASIRTVFIDKGVDRITTRELLTALLNEEEGPWGEANRGKAITDCWLRERLKDILPKTDEAKRARKWKEGRGYTRRHFEDPWARYLPLEGGPSSSHPSVTSASSENNRDKADTYPEADHADQPATKAADTRHFAHHDDQGAGVTAAVAHTKPSSASEIPEADQEVTAKEADEAGQSRERPRVGDNDIPLPIHHEPRGELF